MVKSKIARRLFFLLFIVALLPLILLGIRFKIDMEVLTIYAFYAVFITMIIALFLLRGIIGPIMKLIEGTMKLSDGDLDFRVSIPTDDEFGQLAHSFNVMASSLKEKMDELKNTQDQLIRSAKLAAIGELAANIAHEINNPLTGVLGYATLMLSSPDTTQSQREKLEIIEKEALRARATVRNLLDFSRPKPMIREKRHIKDALEGAIILISKLLEIANINLIRDYADGLPFVKIDLDQMKQVFLNLLNNGLHAMPKGGNLILKSFYNRPEDVIIVEVIDTGSGISPENLKKIFDPFFTTREGEGTGLGLSISYRIIEGHGGRMEAESEIGKGSIFRVILPRTE